MPHVHTIDGKMLTFDDNTCTICHPELQKPSPKEAQEALPRVYRKGNTIVLKVSKVTLITVNHYAEKSSYLVSMQRMMRDQTGKAILGNDQKPMWNKLTIRITPDILKSFLNQTAQLVNEVETQNVTPPRD